MAIYLRYLNERNPDGRFVCPVCERPIRASDATADDGMYLRHSECRRGIVRASWEGRTVRVSIAARDWDDQAWRQRFETDLRRTGWRLVAIEPPSPSHSEYVYILAPESTR